MKRVVLASGSPRRRELLKKLNIDFEIITSDVDETIDFVSPEEMVENLALRKAKAVFDKINDDNLLVIGADTIVYYDGEVLGKPIDEEEIKQLAKESKLLVTMEEHQDVAGLGGVCAEIMAGMSGDRAILHRAGLNNQFSEVTGSQQFLREYYGICADKLMPVIENILKGTVE